MSNIIVSDTKDYLKPFNRVQRKRTQARLKMVSRKCVYKSYIFDLYVWREFGIK